MPARARGYSIGQRIRRHATLEEKELRDLSREVERLRSEVRSRSEEVRGIFAIGAIAALVAVRAQLETATLFGFPILSLLDFLLAFWILYVVVMAIGLSEDIYGPVIAKFCRRLGKTFFATGTIFIAALIITEILVYVVMWIVSGGFPTELTFLALMCLLVTLFWFKRQGTT